MLNVECGMLNAECCLLAQRLRFLAHDDDVDPFMIPGGNWPRQPDLLLRLFYELYFLLNMQAFCCLDNRVDDKGSGKTGMGKSCRG